jgi:hypothetical protein
MSLVRLQESFCVGGYGAVLLPLEVPCTKSTSRERKILSRLHEKTIGAVGKRGRVTGQAGLELSCDQENWRATNFATAQQSNISY